MRKKKESEGVIKGEKILRKRKEGGCEDNNMPIDSTSAEKRRKMILDNPVSISAGEVVSLPGRTQ